jgi:hypothetical protein
MIHGVNEIIRQPLLPPVNSPRHLLIKWNVDCAKQPDHEQTRFAEPFPQP